MVVLVLLITHHHWPQGPNLTLARTTAIIALARSAADYALGRNVYFACTVASGLKRSKRRLSPNDGGLWQLALADQALS